MSITQKLSEEAKWNSCRGSFRANFLSYRQKCSALHMRFWTIFLYIRSVCWTWVEACFTDGCGHECLQFQIVEKQQKDLLTGKTLIYIRIFNSSFLFCWEGVDLSGRQRKEIQIRKIIWTLYWLQEQQIPCLVLLPQKILAYKSVCGFASNESLILFSDLDIKKMSDDESYHIILLFMSHNNNVVRQWLLPFYKCYSFHLT